MARFSIIADVTISIMATVEAADEAAALKAAQAFDMPDLCHCCSQEHDPDEKTWDVDELDGEAQNMRVE